MSADKHHQAMLKNLETARFRIAGVRTALNVLGFKDAAATLTEADRYIYDAIGNARTLRRRK